MAGAGPAASTSKWSAKAEAAGGTGGSATWDHRARLARQQRGECTDRVGNAHRDREPVDDGGRLHDDAALGAEVREEADDLGAVAGHRQPAVADRHRQHVDVPLGDDVGGGGHGERVAGDVHLDEAGRHLVAERLCDRRQEGGDLEGVVGWLEVEPFEQPDRIDEQFGGTEVAGDDQAAELDEIVVVRGLQDRHRA